MQSVLRFMGLDTEGDVMTTSVLNATESGISASVSQHFSHFEKTTGWKLVGEYDAMDSILEDHMRAYFRPLNQHLFDLIGEQFEEWD